MSIFVDDLEIGRAEAIEIDDVRKELRFGGLASPANMFFSGLPGEPGAFDHSSGPGAVVLAVRELPRWRPQARGVVAVT